MKLPFPKFLQKNEAIVTICNGIDTVGKPNIVETKTYNCVVFDTSKTVYDAQGKQATLNSIVVISGDICSEVEVLDGYVKFSSLGKQFNIFKGRRVRNPDGTVHHVELELM